MFLDGWAFCLDQVTANKPKMLIEADKGDPQLSTGVALPTCMNISIAGYQCDVLKDSSIRNLDHDRHYPSWNSLYHSPAESTTIGQNQQKRTITKH